MSIKINVLQNGECQLYISDIDKEDSLEEVFTSLDYCKVLGIAIEEITNLGWTGLYFFSKLRAVANEKGIKVKLIR